MLCRGHIFFFVTLLVFAGQIVSLPVTGQELYAPGFVVLETGDTVTGEVAYLRENFTGIEFMNRIKVKSDRKRYKYHISQLTAYRSGDELFRRMRIQPLQQISFITNYYRIVPYGGEQQFLKVLSEEGKLHLYERQWIDQMDDYISSFFLIKRENQPLMVRADQGIFGLKRKVLSDYFSDCPLLQEKLEAGEFSLPFQMVDFYEVNCK